MNTYTMQYDQGKEQWLVEFGEINYFLHCGESFELYIGKRPMRCRLELANNWYVIMDNTSFDLRENSQYMIKL